MPIGQMPADAGIRWVLGARQGVEHGHITLPSPPGVHIFQAIRACNRDSFNYFRSFDVNGPRNS